MKILNLLRVNFILLFITALLLNSNSVFAQLDSVHWIPPLTSRSISSSGGVFQQSIYISTPEAVAFNVEIRTGDGTLLATVNVSNAAPVRYDLANGNNQVLLATANVGSVNTNKGLIFSGSKQFFVNYRARSGAQGGSLTCKGQAAKGREFFWGGAPNYGNHNDINAITGMMAIEDGTTITITGYDTSCEFRLGTDPDGLTADTITINLDEGNSYVLEAIKQEIAANSTGWIGAKIIANKDIVVNMGNMLGGVSPGAAGRDIAIDQAVPTKFLGDEHLLIRGNGSNVSELATVVATVDGTEISVNGVIKDTIDAGEFYIATGNLYSANKNMYISASEPIYVFQVLSGGTNVNTIGLNLIPPIGCLLPTEVNSISSIEKIVTTNYTGGATILTTVGAIVLINGVAPTALPKTVTGNPDWVTYIETGLTGNVEIISTGPMAAGVFGNNGNAGFAGYFSGFGAKPSVSLVSGSCAPGIVLEEAGGFTSYQWLLNGVAIPGETNSSVNVAIPGSYQVFTIEGFCNDTSNAVYIPACPTSIGATKTTDSIVESSPNVYDAYYKVVVENTGSFRLFNAQVTDTLVAPACAGITVLSAPSLASGGGLVTGSPNGTFNPDVDNRLLLGIDSLPAGEKDTIFYAIRVNMTAPNCFGVFANNAYFTGSEISPNDGSGAGGYTDTVSGTTICLPPLNETTVTYSSGSFSISDSPDTPAISGWTGGAFSAIPAGLTINNASGEVIPASSADGVYAIRYIYGSGACTDTLVEMVEITSYTVQVNVVVNTPIINQGALAEYLITVKNTGATNVSNLEVFDTLTAGFSYFADTVYLYGGATMNIVDNPSLNATGVISWDNFDIPAGDSIAIVLVVNSDSTALSAGTYHNSASATVGGSSGGITPYVGLSSNNENLTVLDNLGKGTSAPCQTGIFQVYKTGRKSFLAELDVITGNYNPTGPVPNGINAVGFNLVDGYIYGSFKLDKRRKFIRIDADGYVYSTGVDLAKGVYSGDMDTSGFWYGRDGSKIVKIETATFTKTTLTPSGTMKAADMAFRKEDGKFYGVNDNPAKLYTYDPLTNTASSTTLTGSISNENGGAYGAAWAALDGYIYVSKNNSGKIYRIDVASNRTNLALNAQAGLNANDGYSCPTVLPPFDDAPIAVGDVNMINKGDTALGNVLTNDSDPDGDTLVINTTPVSGPLNGSVTLNADGSYTYIPNSTFTGTDVFQYQVCDTGLTALCDTASVVIEVILDSIGINNPPIALADAVVTYTDTVLTGNLLNNDFDPDGDALTITVIPITNPINGNVTIALDGSFTYFPNASFEGNDQFSYRIIDSGTPFLSDTGVVTISVIALPITNNVYAEDDNVYTIVNTSATGNLLNNDFDPEGDAITIEMNPVSGPTNGVVVINPSNGDFTYTPNNNFTGSDFFVYQIGDNNAFPDTSLGAVYIVVSATEICGNGIDEDGDGLVDENCLNAIPDTINVNEDNNIAINVITNDVGAFADTLSVDSITGTINGVLMINMNGTFSYTPNTNFFGMDSLTYVVCDTNMPKTCDTAKVIITINSINDSPIAVSDTVNVNEDDNNVIIDVQANDSDIENDVLTTTIVNGPTSGGVATVINGDSLDYTPPANFNGTDTIIYRVCDTGPLCDVDTIFITSSPINDAPTAMDDAISIPEESTGITIDVQDNDTDIDGDPLTTTVISGTATVMNGDSLSYIPSVDFVGNDTITYMVCDAGLPMLCDTAILVITVTPVLDTVSIITPEDSVTTICADSLTDFGRLATSISSCNTPSNGSVVIMGTCINYTPTTSFVGNDTLCIVSCNGMLCDTSIVIVTITPVDTDGDGDLDATDPDPTDPCVWSTNQNLINVNLSWNALDCDGDGVINEDELLDGTDLLDYCDVVKTSITHSVINTVGCELFVPNGFSPNGDGMNDVFVIGGLEDFPNHKLLIFNRWGSRVFEAAPYNNDWGGLGEFGITIGGKELPGGTYFYILELGDGETEALKGYIYLNK